MISGTGKEFAAASGASLKDLMALRGHNSEHGAINYQREARGNDQVIRYAIDDYIEPAKGHWRHQDDSAPEAQLRNANGPWRSTRGERDWELCPASSLTWAFVVERVTVLGFMR